MRLSPLALLPPIVFLGIAALFAVGMFRENPNDFPLAIKGQNAPALTLEALPGAQVFSAEELNAPGIKLVNFWASWCAPCRAEHPNLTALTDEGIPIYGVNYKDDPADALAFLNELGNPYTGLGTDPRGRNGLDWGVVAMPETFVIDGKGRIVLRHAGPLTSAVIQRVFRPVLRESVGMN